MVTCEQIRQACRRAVGAQATRTRIDASRSHFQAAASITANRAHFSRVVSPRLPSLGGHSVEYHRSTHTFRQRRLRTCRRLHARAKELHPTPSRRVCSTCGPSSRLPDAIEASFAAAEASWRVYSYSSSPPALTPPPHSTAQHHQSQDRLTTHLGSWPGAAAKPRSPTRPRSSVV